MFSRCVEVTRDDSRVATQLSAARPATGTNAITNTSQHDRKRDIGMNLHG
jgi:hypothetical protein